MNVVCLGDSNTYGFDPRSFFGKRYPREIRWVDLLQEKSGWTIRNEGMNGREIPARSIDLPDNTDFLIVMLGTNDLLQGASAATAADRMEKFLNGLKIGKERILLIAPPDLKFGTWVNDSNLIDESVRLAECYRCLAERNRIRYLDSSRWNIPLCFDGVHFTEEGHQIFAQRLWEVLHP